MVFFQGRSLSCYTPPPPVLVGGMNISILLLGNMGKEFSFPSETLGVSQTRCHCGYFERYLKNTTLIGVFERIFRRVEVLLLNKPRPFCKIQERQVDSRGEIYP